MKNNGVALPDIPAVDAYAVSRYVRDGRLYFLVYYEKSQEQTMATLRGGQDLLVDDAQSKAEMVWVEQVEWLETGCVKLRIKAD